MIIAYFPLLCHPPGYGYFSCFVPLMDTLDWYVHEVILNERIDNPLFTGGINRHRPSKGYR